MTRAVALLSALILVTTIFAGCFEESEIEEFIDDVLGCVDENAANYDENATTQALEDCIYLVSLDTFNAKLESSMDIHELLDESPKVGYSIHMISSSYNEDFGSELTTNMDRIVMIDLANSSAYFKVRTEVPSLALIDFSIKQVGESVSVESSFSGISEVDPQSSKTLTRDADPDVLQLIDAFEQNEDTQNQPGITVIDHFPLSANYNITWDSIESKHVLFIDWFDEESNQEMTMSVSLSEEEQLISYVMTAENESSNSIMEYNAFWGDSVVINIEDNLPRTSLPIDWNDEFIIDPYEGKNFTSVGDTNEWTVNQFWGCGLVLVNASGLDDWQDETIEQALTRKPNYPEWCGQILGIDELPPLLIDGTPGFNETTNWALESQSQGFVVKSYSSDELLTYFLDYNEEDCSNSSLTWFSENSACGDVENISMYINNEILVIENIDSGTFQYFRYEIIGEHMFFGELNPTIQEPAPKPVDSIIEINVSQIFNAPISDFEFRTLECNSSSNLDDCTIIHSEELKILPVTLSFEDGSWLTYSYSDNDGDGMISAGDELLITNVTDIPLIFEIYDTWAEEYVSQSKAVTPNLPGFSGLLGIICLITAVFTSKRQ